MKLLIVQLVFLCCALLGSAQVTLIPDPNFEQALIDLGIDTDFTVNGQVATADVENITELWVAGKKIQDLTGIEDFVALELLFCTGNELTFINLNTLENLQSLDIAANFISTLDLSNNINLEVLGCSDNDLSSIDLSNNTLLEILFLRNQTATSEPRNEISEIDLSNNPNLEFIIVSYLGLESLNLKNGNNELLTMMEATNNSLSCIQVDDEDAANKGMGPYAGWEVDPQVTYSEDCSLGTEDIAPLENLVVYPNPVEDMVYLQTPPGISIEKVSVYDVLGRLQKEFPKGLKNMSISKLLPGVYFLKVETEENNIVTKQIIKK